MYAVCLALHNEFFSAESIIRLNVEKSVSDELEIVRQELHFTLIFQAFPWSVCTKPRKRVNSLKKHP
jgi:hypothetical protein